MSEGTAMDMALLTPDREKAWERFVNTSPHATFAHLLGWRNVVEETYHHLPYYLMATEGNTVAGLLPLFLVRSPLFGRFLVTAPYLSYGGLLAQDEEATCTLISAARKHAIAQRAKYVEIRGLIKVDQGLTLKDKYCTFFLPLSADPSDLWPRLEARARRSVRKALKSGLQIERGHHLVEAFAEVISRHMRDLGTPFHRMPFYQSIAKQFPHQSEILMVRHMHRYIGGLLLLTYRETVNWVYGAALMEYKGFAPMSLLVWEAIRYGCEKGFAYFDFGRSRWDSGTALFKRQWGAKPLPLFYEYHLADGVKLPDMDPTNPRFRFAVAVWRRLPPFCTKALGPLIIKDIP